MRGEFIRGDGLVLPNNVTRAGARLILNGAFNALPVQIWMGLGRGVFTPALTITEVVEPTIGVGGYSRPNLSAATADSWGSAQSADSGAYVESRLVTFTATAGSQFDQPIERVLLVSAEDNDASPADVFSISSALPEQLTITPDTPLIQRQFQYRIYL